MNKNAEQIIRKRALEIRGVYNALDSVSESLRASLIEIIALSVQINDNAGFRVASDELVEQANFLRDRASRLTLHDRRLDSVLVEMAPIADMLSEDGEAIQQSINEIERASGNIHRISDPAVRQQVYDLTGGTCAYCEASLGATFETSTFQVDHVVPKSKGGPDNIVNYVPSCEPCNSKKFNHHVIHLIKKLRSQESNVVDFDKGAA